MDGNGDYACPPRRDIEKSPTGLALWEKRVTLGWRSSLVKLGDFVSTATPLRRAVGLAVVMIVLDSFLFLFYFPSLFCVV